MMGRERWVLGGGAGSLVGQENGIQNEEVYYIRAVPESAPFFIYTKQHSLSTNNVSTYSLEEYTKSLQPVALLSSPPTGVLP